MTSRYVGFATSAPFGADVPSARDLVGLANYEIYLKMMVDGVQTKPFSARTLPPDMHMLHVA